MIVRGDELRAGDHIHMVDGVVLDVADGRNANMVRVTYSPRNRDDILTGFWYRAEGVHITRKEGQ